MKARLFKLAQAALLLGALTTAAVTAHAQESDRYTLHLTNSSGFDIYHVYLTSSDVDTWGQDLLGEEVLATAGAVDFINVVAGEHDLKLVDEDGDSCVRMKVKFFQNKAINITRDWLIGCEFHNPAR
jgi:hypothetical protein